MALCVQGIFDNTCFDPRIVVGSSGQCVLVFYILLSSHHCLPLYHYIQKRESSVLLCLHGELDALSEGIDMGKSSRDSCPWRRVTKVSSMYWYHREGGFGLFWWPSFQYCIYRSANTGDSGEPTGAPSTCFYSWTSSGKYVDFHA